MKRKVISMTESEYDKNADDYLACGFRYDFYWSLAVMKEIVEKRGILLNLSCIKEGLNKRDEIWEQVK